MVIEILKSWKKPNTNFAIVKTSGGIFVISRGRTIYDVEGDVERFVVRPCRLYKKPIYVMWSVRTNPEDASKSSEIFRD